MSDSDTRHSSTPSQRTMATKMQLPATITSARAGSRPGLCLRSSSDSVASVRNTSSMASRSNRKWWMASRSHSASPSSTAAIVVMVPARPTNVFAAVIAGHAHGRCRRARPRSPRCRHGAPRAAGGSDSMYCSVRRTHPMSIERDASTSVVPTMNSVEPPPMSTTRNGPSAGSSSAVAPRNDSSASCSPESSSGRTPMIASAASKNSSRLAGIAGRRRRRHPDPVDAVLVEDCPVAAEDVRRVRCDRIGIQHPGAVDALAEAGDGVHPGQRLLVGPEPRATRSRVELVPQSIAARTGSSWRELTGPPCQARRGRAQTGQSPSCSRPSSAARCLDPPARRDRRRRPGTRPSGRGST